MIYNTYIHKYIDIYIYIYPVYIYTYVCDGSRQGINLFPHMDTLFVYDVRDVPLIHECPNKHAICLNITLLPKVTVDCFRTSVLTSLCYRKSRLIDLGLGFFWLCMLICLFSAVCAGLSGLLYSLYIF